MRGPQDKVSKSINIIIDASIEPLETKEIELAVKRTRTVILYRLRELRADGFIKGKQVGSGKGTWIWWSNKLRCGNE